MKPSEDNDDRKEKEQKKKKMKSGKKLIWPTVYENRGKMSRR